MSRQHVIDVADLYMRTPPFSFNAVKVGDIAFFPNGKAMVITRKIKPDAKGQCWWGFEFESGEYGVYGFENFNTDGHCNNTGGLNITHILKTGIKLNGRK